MDLAGAVELGGASVVQWCGVCNAEPAIGQIDVEHEEHEMPTIAIGEKCLRGMADEQGGIEGWTGEYDELDIPSLV